ncbi:MAG: AEC family transporter [Clostridia bacterium]|nr:AEC family transporter [Clostridia bacterium]
MLNDILYSAGVIAPIFIMVILGFVLKQTQFLSESFFNGCDKIGFKLCLPCLLFIDIAFVDLNKSLNLKLILFCCMAVTVLFVLSTSIVSVFLKDNAKRGAFIQGMCRSNAAILGVTVARNMFPVVGEPAIAMCLPFVVTLYNIYSVIVLSVFAPVDKKMTAKEMTVNVCKKIYTNPLIIAIALALLWNVSGLKMPGFANQSISYLGEMAVPLALISLGASFDLNALKGRVGLAVLSSVMKTVVVPLVAVFCAYFCGIRTVGLGIVLIIFGGPTAVSSYIMAKQMQSDYKMAGQIIVISTLMCIFTLFLGVFILRTLALI